MGASKARAPQGQKIPSFCMRQRPEALGSGRETLEMGINKLGEKKLNGWPKEMKDVELKQLHCPLPSPPSNLPHEPTTWVPTSHLRD